MRSPFRTLWIAAILFIYQNLTGQDWTWKWVSTGTQRIEDTWCTVLATDSRNNVYCYYSYTDTLYFGDSVYPRYHWKGSNLAVIKYSPGGEMENTLHISTLPYGTIMDVRMVVDKNFNMYISGMFFDRVFIQDTFVNAGGGGPWPGSPDLFLVKVTHDFQVDWIKVINGLTPCHSLDMSISDDQYIYWGTAHQSYNLGPSWVDVLGQDSLFYPESMSTFMKLDTNGAIQWIKPMYFDPGGSLSGYVKIGADSNLYVLGLTTGDFVVDGDTVFHPYYPEFRQLFFLIKTDRSGNVMEKEFLDWGIYIIELEADPAGNLYLSAQAMDTITIGTYTIPVPVDTLNSLIMKLSPDHQIIWYEMVSNPFSYNQIWFNIKWMDDSLYFAATCNRTFTLADSTFTVGSYREGIFGQFTPEGEMIHAMLTTSSLDLRLDSRGFEMDRCGNFILSGCFRGISIFGPDTLYSYVGWQSDGFIAKLNRWLPPPPDIGPDTVACHEFILAGPPGYVYYVWNDSLSASRELKVHQSGKYWLAVANEDCCWAYDTVEVTIVYGPPPFSLGNDTLLAKQDSMLLQLPVGFSSYLWSTGDTTQSINVRGANLALGPHLFWGEVIEDPCVTRDSILVTVTWNPGMEEMDLPVIQLFPNPATNILTVKSDVPGIRWKLVDLTGRVYSEGLLYGPLSTIQTIDIAKLQPGLYIVELRSNRGVLRRKIIKH